MACSLCSSQYSFFFTLVYDIVLHFVPTVRNANALLMNVFLRSGLMGYEDGDELGEEIRRVNIDGAGVLELWDVWACNLRLRVLSGGC